MARHPNSPQFSLLKDVSENTFFDIVADVCKIEQVNGQAIAYVSDYTENTSFAFFESPQEDGGFNPPSILYNRDEWNGPYGHRVARMWVHNPHAQWLLHNVRVGDIVVFRNVHCRFQDSYLQLVLHQDRLYHYKVFVSKVSSYNTQYQNQAAKVEERRKHYWAGREKRAIKSGGQKPSRNDRKVKNSERASKSAGSSEREDSAIVPAQKQETDLATLLSPSGEHCICLFSS